MFLIYLFFFNTRENVACVGQGCVYGLLMCITCHWLYSCLYREKLRAKFGLPADPCCDCCVHFCCEACALCQEHAELKARGLDPSKGIYIYIHTKYPYIIHIYQRLVLNLCVLKQTHGYR